MREPDSARLESFMGKMVGDMGAAATASLVVLGDRLGLYRALAEGGPWTSSDLAERGPPLAVKHRRT